jgi:hypothetical protein
MNSGGQKLAKNVLKGIGCTRISVSDSVSTEWEEEKSIIKCGMRNSDCGMK